MTEYKINIQHKGIENDIYLYKDISIDEIDILIENFNLDAKPIAFYDLLNDLIFPLSVVAIAPQYFIHKYALLSDPVIYDQDDDNNDNDEILNNDNNIPVFNKLEIPTLELLLQICNLDRVITTMIQIWKENCPNNMMTLNEFK